MPRKGVLGLESLYIYDSLNPPAPPHATPSDMVQNIAQEESILLSPPYNTPSYDGPPIDLSIIASAEGKDFLITLTPPQGPPELGSRAPVDIVLVIDVSGSMSDPAPAPGEDGPTDLTILDVVKHAVRTIVTSMGRDDRVSVVTFSTSAKVVVPLTRTNESGKELVMETVESLRTEASTNIWDGLKTGMNVLTSKQLGDASDAHDQRARSTEMNPDQPLPPQRLSSIFLLTDGQPNVEPPKGHIPILRLYLELHPPESTRFTINTFGFGYGLDSQLLSDIAAVGKGTYGFIPDPGMVGTVFVHAAANTYATFCDACELSIELEDGAMVRNLEVLGGLETVRASWGIKVDLGAVQYGQTKDVVVRVRGGLGEGKLTATAKYRPWSAPPSTPDISAARVIDAGLLTPTLDFNLLYHTYRSIFVQEILAIFTSPKARRGSAPPVPSFDAVQRLTTLARTIREGSDEMGAGKPPRSDALALAKDIEGEVIMALNSGTDRGAFSKWGRHYLPSFARSHQRQQCSNFKDESLQVYGRNSPLFVKSRNEMDSLFDNLPPPTPTGEDEDEISPPASPVGGYSPTMRRFSPVGIFPEPSLPILAAPRKSMASWNNKAAPCFSGHCLVTLATPDGLGNTGARVDSLRRGTKLRTPVGSRLVTAIIRTEVVDGRTVLCSIGEQGLMVTPWHPIKSRDHHWIFPAEIAPPRMVACDAIYSILLEPDQNPDAHSVWIGGVLCVTLGHGVVRSSQDHDDVRAHTYLGDYRMVVASMAENPAFFEEDGLLEAYGVLRSEDGGLVRGFSWRTDGVQSFTMREANGLRWAKGVMPV